VKTVNRKNDKRRITVNNITKELNQHLLEIESLIAQETSRLKQYKGLEKGKLQVTSSHGNIQYLFVENGTNAPKYMPVIEKEKVRLFAQREYDEKMYEHLNTTKARLSRFIKNYDENSIDAIYENMCDGRKRLVTPIRPDKETIINTWMEMHPGGMNTIDDEPDIRTNRGDYVRSKSEKILADYFYEAGIPYQCEPKFTLFSGKNVYPDFVLLNVRNNRTIYWEHFGKVDEAAYVIRNMSKLMDYEKSGLLLGDNLIITLETRERPLDMELIKRNVEQFLI
jgi:hypothetical protein